MLLLESGILKFLFLFLQVRFRSQQLACILLRLRRPLLSAPVANSNFLVILSDLLLLPDFFLSSVYLFVDL